MANSVDPGAGSTPTAVVDKTGSATPSTKPTKAPSCWKIVVDWIVGSVGAVFVVLAVVCGVWGYMSIASAIALAVGAVVFVGLWFFLHYTGLASAAPDTGGHSTAANQNPPLDGQPQRVDISPYRGGPGAALTSSTGAASYFLGNVFTLYRTSPTLQRQGTIPPDGSYYVWRTYPSEKGPCLLPDTPQQAKPYHIQVQDGQFFHVEESDKSIPFVNDPGKFIFVNAANRNDICIVNWTGASPSEADTVPPKKESSSS